MSIIPTPEQARELRALLADHPLIALALEWLRANDVDHVRDVVDVLRLWEHAPQLSEREVQGLYARFVPEPAERCARCGLAVRYVTDGPDPGWWTHTDLGALLAGDGQQPHPPTPDYGGTR